MFKSLRSSVLVLIIILDFLAKFQQIKFSFTLLWLYLFPPFLLSLLIGESLTENRVRRCGLVHAIESFANRFCFEKCDDEQYSVTGQKLWDCL